MLYYILSDIHGNLEALVSVLKDIAQDPEINSETRDKIVRELDHWGRTEKEPSFSKPARTFCKIVSLGDIIDYGARPNECVEIIKNIVDISVLGNHEERLFNQEQRTQSKAEIKAQIEWTERNLSLENKAYLEDLYKRDKFFHQVEDITFSHGVPTHPHQFYYNRKLEAVQWFNTESFKDKISFMGHCHTTYFCGNLKGQLTEYKLNDLAIPFGLKGYHKVLISVPSVGQPRDRNSQTGYLIYDSKAQQVLIRRLDYDITVTQKQIMEAGIHQGYAARLERGL